MKANHVPAEFRIRNRIWKLWLQQEHMWSSKKYYPKCQGCGVTNVQETLTGHYKNCRFKGLEKQIAYYESLLKGL